MASQLGRSAYILRMHIDLVDYKRDFWRLGWPGLSAIERYLYKGDAYYKVWWHVLDGPYELRNYSAIPIPLFTDWWTE